MMKLLGRMVLFGALSAVAGLSIGCGGQENSGSGSVTATDDPVMASLPASRRHRSSMIDQLDGGAPAAPAASDPPATSVSAAIAAAQTADGQAIPQGAGPGGACPQVLVLLGFWSCPTLGQTCSYSASGVQHDCACDRTDGEGQTPSWVCDQ